MYNLLAICLSLAVLLTLNALASIAAALLWRVGERRWAGNWSAQARAKTIFWLRVLPPACSIACVFALLLPSYLVYEPEHSNEVVGFKLGAVAFLSAVGITLALWRGAAAWFATRKLLGEWMSNAETIRLEGILIPAFCIEHPFPVLAIVGTFRPKLFVARQLFDLLDSNELRAAALHENGHLASRDIFKNVLMQACRDVLSLVPCGRSLDRAWRGESEIAADEFAARHGDCAGTLALAAALVKISRAAPPNSTPKIASGAFLVEETGDIITKRVRRLVWLAETKMPLKSQSSILHFAELIFLFSFLLLFALLVTQTNVLQAFHFFIEHFVSALQ